MNEQQRDAFPPYTEAVRLWFPGLGNLCRLVILAMLLAPLHVGMLAYRACQSSPGLRCSAQVLFRQANGLWGIVPLAALILWVFWHAVADYLREVRRCLGHGAFWRDFPTAMRFPLGLVTVPVLLSRIAAVPIVEEEIGGVQRLPATAFFGLARGTHRARVESRWKRSIHRPRLWPPCAVLIRPEFRSLFLGVVRRFRLVPSRTVITTAAQSQHCATSAGSYTRLFG